MTAEQLWRAGKLAGLVVAFAGISFAQNAPDEVTQLKEEVVQLQKQVELLSQKLNELTAGKAAQPAAPATASPKRRGRRAGRARSAHLSASRA